MAMFVCVIISGMSIDCAIVVFLCLWCVGGWVCIIFVFALLGCGILQEFMRWASVGCDCLSCVVCLFVICVIFVSDR